MDLPALDSSVSGRLGLPATMQSLRPPQACGASFFPLSVMRMETLFQSRLQTGGPGRQKRQPAGWQAGVKIRDFAENNQRTSMNPISAPITRIAMPPIAAADVLSLNPVAASSGIAGISGSELRILL